MKRRLFLFCLNIFIFTFSFGQTNISGFINANTTWDLSGSPYIVVGNSLVSHGFTLTIKPGVVVKFDSSKALQIDGELIAIGTPQNRITFTSNQAIPHKGHWAKLHFADTSKNAIFDNSGNYISGCILKYCDVLYGGGLGYGSVHIESSAPYISHCKILNSYADGINCSSSNYILDSSVIKNCDGFGLNYCNDAMALCNPKILGDTIESNASGGINFENLCSMNFSYVSIKNCYFISNTGGSTIAARYNAISNSIFVNNYFINNTCSRAVIDLKWLQYDTIKCNKFINNHTSNGCIATYDFTGLGIITNNIFENNSGNFAVAFIKYDGYSNLTFSKNYISNNSSSGYASCFFYAPAVYNQQKVYVDHNIFVNNSGSSALCVMGNGNANFLHLKFNSFSDPASIFELDNQMSYGSTNIYADSNYWGTTNTVHIDSVINDYFDYANLSVVYYEPILLAPIVVDTTCPSIIINTIVSFKGNSDNISIYPNPTSSSLSIELGVANKSATCKVYDILGTEVINKTFTGSKTQINVSALSKGMYFLKVETDEGTAIKKFIKE